jgi:hypothetical protein
MGRLRRGERNGLACRQQSVEPAQAPPTSQIGWNRSSLQLRLVKLNQQTQA